MKSTFVSSFLAVLALSATARFASAQNLITNGSFEQLLPSTAATLAANGSAEILIGDPYDPVYFLTGWAAKWKTVTVYNSAGSTELFHRKAYQVDGTLGYLSNAPSDGDNAIRLTMQYISPTTQYGTIYTSVDLLAGERYHFSLDLLGGVAANDGTLLSVKFLAWEGSTATAPVVENFMVNGLDGGWNTVGFDFIAPESREYEVELQIWDTRNSGAYVYIDNVSLTLASVPEPAAFAALAGLGVLGFALCRRRGRCLVKEEI